MAEVLVRDFQLTTLDAPAIAAQARTPRNA